MSAEIETMMFVKDPPWHGQGQYVGDDPVTSREAIIAAGLNWEVDLNPLFVDNDGDYDEVETHQAVIRQTDNRVLGVVGNRYTPVQNKDAFKFMDALVSDGSMRYHTAGSLRGGQRIWLLGQIGSTHILPKDRVDQFLFLYNSHDGSGSLRCLFTNVRVVCANTARAALKDGKGEGIAIRHTASISQRIEQAKKVLGLATDEFREYNTFCKALTSLKMPVARWNEFTETLIPDNPDAEHNTRAENTRLRLTELFEEGVGSEIEGVRGSGWGAHCAVVEFANYFRTSRGGDEAQARRFESSLFGSGDKLIQNSTKLLQGYIPKAA